MSLKQNIRTASTQTPQHPFIKQAGWDEIVVDEVPLTKGLKLNRRKQDKKIEQVHRLANRMARLLEVLPGGVVVLNGKGIVQQCNAAAIKLLGEPLHGEYWTDVIKRSFSPKTDNSQDLALTNGRLVHISTSPLEDEPGQIVLLNDVTETRQLQLKVSHLQRLSAMGEVAARLAHQIRTPLSSALLYLSPLLKENTDPKLKHSFAQKLHNSIKHMESLIKDMLAYSRGDMANTAPVEINDLCQTVEQQFNAQIDANNYNLKINNAVPDAVVFGSKDALGSALNNLLTNARLACDDQGELSVFVDNVQDEQGVKWIEISVTDNGAGIAREDQDNVLVPFFTTRSSGTGLGLPVVQSIAKAHRGSLSFISELGQGSTFYLRLPQYAVANKHKETGS